MPTEDSPESGGSTDPSHQLPAPLGQMLEVEKARLERDNRRSGVVEKAIELADTQDRRQHEYATAALEANMKIQVDRMALQRRLAWVGVAFFAILVFGLLGFALYGDDEQRAVAERFGGFGLIGLAGYGIFTTLATVVKALAKP